MTQALTEIALLMLLIITTSITLVFSGVLVVSILRWLRKW